MATTPFVPSKYTETHHCIFDKKTGEILATETRWTDEGAEGGREINTELVRRVAEDSGRSERDVDVLQVPEPATQGRLRVDVTTRKLVSAGGEDDRYIARPARLGRP